MAKRNHGKVLCVTRLMKPAADGKPEFFSFTVQRTHTMDTMGLEIVSCDDNCFQ